MAWHLLRRCLLLCAAWLAAVLWCEAQVLKCHPQCKTCHLFDYSLEWHCLECQPGYQLWVDGCFQDCPEGQYRYGYQCEPCTANCARCVGSLVHECTVCAEGYTFDFRRLCVPDCATGTYPAPDGQTCASCDPFCRTCIAGSRVSCLSCYTGYTLRVLEPRTNTGECMQSCPDGFYRDAPNDLRCIQCGRFCAQCNSPYNCLRCQPGASLYRGFCYVAPQMAVQTRITFDQYLNSGAGKSWDDSQGPSWEVLVRRRLQEQEVPLADGGAAHQSAR